MTTNRVRKLSAGAERIEGTHAAIARAEPSSAIPSGIMWILNEHQARVYQARAILELASDLMTRGIDNAQERARVMCAIDGAIGLLNPIDNLGDEVALRQAAEGIDTTDETAAACVSIAKDSRDNAVDSLARAEATIILMRDAAHDSSVSDGTRWNACESVLRELNAVTTVLLAEDSAA